MNRVNSTEPITVLIVDDHPVVREGLNAMLSAQPDIRVVGEAPTGEAALELWAQLRPAVILMDLLLPGINGLEVIRQLTEKSSNSRIIVMTSAGGDEEIYRALESGARGFLFKDMVREILVDAIRSVHSGRRYLPPQVGARMAENFPRPGLTSREIDVLRLVAIGLKNKEIAARLDISETTVNSHVKHCLEKLDAADRTHAVTIAFRRGIIRL
jgi:DNA-binding NarL/FixJ family response regulator